MTKVGSIVADGEYKTPEHQLLVKILRRFLTEGELQSLIARYQAARKRAVRHSTPAASAVDKEVYAEYRKSKSLSAAAKKVGVSVSRARTAIMRAALEE